MTAALFKTIIDRPLRFRRLRKNQINKAGRLAEQGIRRGIKQGVGPAGPFKAYAPSTIAAKRRRGVRHPERVTLVDTGALLDSISRSVEGRSAVVSITAPYAAFVDDARPFNGIAPKTLATLRDYIEGAWMGTLTKNKAGPVSDGAPGPVGGPIPVGPVTGPKTVGPV